MDDKTLVMIFRGYHDVSTSIKRQLQKLKGLEVTAIESENQTQPSFSKAHVVISDPSQIPANFPWSSFTSVIAYEDKIEWLSKILMGRSLALNHFICLKSVTREDRFQDITDSCIMESKFKLQNESASCSTA